MGKRIFGIGRLKARSEGRMKQFGQERNEAMEGFEGVMNGLSARLGDSNLRSNLTADDRFGDVIQRNTDSVRTNANNTKQALARILSAGGGDVTGSGALTMDRADQGANESIGGMLSNFEMTNEQMNASERARGDSLSNLLLGAEGNLMQLADASLQNEILGDIQRRTANKQFGASILGSVLSTGSKFINPTGGGGG